MLVGNAPPVASDSMTLFFRSIPICTALAAVLASSALPAQERLSQAEFQKLHADLNPPAAPWEGIPWRLSILEACAEAAKEKKPVYMLVRSGHPLGCV